MYCRELEKISTGFIRNRNPFSSSKINFHLLRSGI